MQKSILSLYFAFGLAFLGSSQAAFAGQQTTTRTGYYGNSVTTTRTVPYHPTTTTTRTGPNGNSVTKTRTVPYHPTATTTRTGPYGNSTTIIRTVP